MGSQWRKGLHTIQSRIKRQLLRKYSWRIDLRPKANPFPRAVSSGALAIGDIDQDGFPDVFVGEYLKNLDFGLPGDGFLFMGNGSQFKLSEATDFRNLGMITDAQFADLNQDGWLDLIVVGIGWELSLS